jgi:integrase
MDGRQHRKSTGTRTWGVAEEKAIELQNQLDRGSHVIVRRVGESETATITQAIETFLSAKTSEGLSLRRLDKLRFQLTRFREFMDNRSRFFPTEIRPEDVIDYRATWLSSTTDAWKSGTTRQKAQQNLRGFLRSCCKANLPDLLSALKTIRLSKIDKERLKPQPFTEKEIKHLLAQVPKTFSEVHKMTALIHCMVATGLAIRDTVQLERVNLKDGWLRIERQKTGRPVLQRLDPALVTELLSIAGERYIFWDGRVAVTSAVGKWQDDLKVLMQDAGLWIRGNLSHRFRDTAVDFWLGSGCSMTEVASMLGDTVAVCEKHYADLVSKRMKDRLAKLPVRVW